MSSEDSQSPIVKHVAKTSPHLWITNDSLEGKNFAFFLIIDVGLLECTQVEKLHFTFFCPSLQKFVDCSQSLAIDGRYAFLNALYIHVYYGRCILVCMASSYVW